MAEQWTHKRAQIARLTQSYAPDHPKLIAARQEYLAIRLEDQLAAGIAGGVRLTDSQIGHLVGLLTASTHAA